MKKWLFVLLSFLLVGCGKNNSKDILKQIEKKIGDLGSYKVDGELTMYNGDNKYTYSVTVNHKKDSKYRVSLINKVNSHEQIILRNDDGVYVLTPSLNKSFKFQSDWPYNNSQVYILEQILTDIKNDNEKTFEKKDSEYIYTTKVNYSTNNNLTKQKVYFDKDCVLKKVEVYNGKDELQMEFKIKNFEADIRLEDDIFKLDKNAETKTNDKVSSVVDDVIYPMYLPVNTYLESEERISTETGERVILTFGGDNAFTLIEETITVGKDLDVNLCYGEPDIIIDTIGSVDDSSINWLSGGIEYSVVSTALDKDELISVAKSISSASITK